MPSLPYVQEGVKYHVHGGQICICLYIFFHSEKGGRKADKVWSENLILKFQAYSHFVLSEHLFYFCEVNSRFIPELK